MKFKINDKPANLYGFLSKFDKSLHNQVKGFISFFDVKNCNDIDYLFDVNCNTDRSVKVHNFYTYDDFSGKDVVWCFDPDNNNLIFKGSW